MTLVETRTCRSSKLRVIQASRGDSGYRVTKTKYPAISALERTPSEDRQPWNRFDAVGYTLYAAETKAIAYAEVLSTYKKTLGRHDALAADAAALGMSLSDSIESIATEWGERGLMGRGALPAIWRNSRQMVEVLLPSDGWWVDIEHPDSIAAIAQAQEVLLAKHGIAELTTATLRDDNRIITTAIAEQIRSTTLDDGSTPIGIHFGSKHGGGWCRAVWFDPSNPHMAELAGEAILINDSDLKQVTDRYEIRCF